MAQHVTTQRDFSFSGCVHTENEEPEFALGCNHSISLAMTGFPRFTGATQQRCCMCLSPRCGTLHFVLRTVQLNSTQARMLTGLTNYASS